MTPHQLLAEWSQWFWPFFANHLKIRFEPAKKDGQPVSVRGALEFAFSLY